eukprot:2093028-Rhodomonas_salina.1
MSTAAIASVSVCARAFYRVHVHVTRHLRFPPLTAASSLISVRVCSSSSDRRCCCCSVFDYRKRAAAVCVCAVAAVRLYCASQLLPTPCLSTAPTPPSSLFFSLSLTLPLFLPPPSSLVRVWLASSLSQ